MVNGKRIYPLVNTKPIVIPVYENNPRLVITDGYHITKPLKLVYKDLHTYCFKVTCAISDLQLLIGFFILAAFYLTGIYIDEILLKIASFFPLLYLLGFYYISRKEFIKLIPVLD